MVYASSCYYIGVQYMITWKAMCIQLTWIADTMCGLSTNVALKHMLARPNFQVTGGTHKRYVDEINQIHYS